ncbi:glycerol uptake facilitator protein [Pochonia chlamydosporia 170]|uniref:Glycerol uptake facilitator protein n=1 Tax=Pochonia chlamydosporia 170 TaxID=1380566 RepID=A0A179F5S0_METCM|nr:glycerol uptake facilitator protein [Pochonia chlamydosporia 170]OAQ60710.1 glycerol uptake facilitator protein [Pochonia chlamydosporia 170]
MSDVSKLEREQSNSGHIGRGSQVDGNDAAVRQSDLESLPSIGVQSTLQNRSSYFPRAPSNHSARRPRCRGSYSTRHGRQAFPRNATQSSWVDESYQDENPWYGYAKDKPLFSLAQPLPHVARLRKGQTRQGGQRTIPETGDLSRGCFPYTSNAEPTQQSTFQGTSQTVQTNRPGNVLSNASRFGINAEPLGHEECPDVEGKKNADDERNCWAKLRARHPEPLAEFVATFVSIFLGIAGTLNVILSPDKSSIYGLFETSWSWGFAWMLGIYIAGGVSGAHMNPAISFALAIYRRFPWRQCLVYVTAQLLAAFTAGALVFAVFRDTIRHVDPDLKTSWKGFCSAPQDWMSLGGATISQLVQSIIMVIVVFALGDDQNNPPGAGMHAFVLGLLLTTLKLTLDRNTGSALNPAADLGPRLVTLGVGYGRSTVFGDVWWIVGPWAANFAGSVLGGAIYDGLIFVGTESPVNHRIRAFRRKSNESSECC